jgi:ribose-phosphate pyrophosphokinase
VVRGIIGEVRNRSCLIIDDEIASGGTIVEAAKALEENGAKRIFAAAVHPILSGNAVEKLLGSRIERIILGNTVPVADKVKGHEDRFKILDLAPLFARAIRSIHDGDSLTELFPPSVRRKP